MWNISPTNNMIGFCFSSQRYEERIRYIRNLISKNLNKCSYEDFALNVMHPLESSGTQDALARESPVKLTTYSRSSPSMLSLGQHPHRVSPDTKPSRVKSSLLKIPSLSKSSSKGHLEKASGSPPLSRPRSSTNDERVLDPQSSEFVAV